ncbi:hypothetical protein IFM89_018321 [Coptis chinensis]|uniref:KIB1-4 beta-propeller domain-containing protein n=1 Tax=Coptis chinensis TaxID=261450 RepID=A0A835LEN6_9MAGN|nr:hypothetical protein IFM89_018321 [Coptis chinensis]
MTNWSELPEDISDLFLNRLSRCVEDFVIFDVVCKSWRSVAIAKRNKQSDTFFTRFAPWLMLAKRDNDRDESVRSFYSHSSKRIFNIQLPHIKGTRCWGSPYGWLLTIGFDLNIHLLHPLNGIQLSLPSQPMFPELSDCYNNPEYLCRKLVLGSNPSFWSTRSNQGCHVMALFGPYCRLAYATPGDKDWTSLEDHYDYKDIIFFNDHFYAINTDGYLKVCDISSIPPKAIDLASPPEDIYPTEFFYLVEMFGDLHLVVRYVKGEVECPALDYHFDPTRFEVYKFNFDTRSWIELYYWDDKDEALFVGNNASFAISTSKYPEFMGSSIYFTDDHCEFYKKDFCDMGVFDFDEEMVEPF